MERKDKLFLIGSCLTALLVVIPAAILHGVLGYFAFVVYLGLPAGLAFSWFVWREREAARLIHALSAVAVLLAAVWIGFSVFNSTLGYKEVVLICLKGVFLIAVAYSFFIPVFSSLVAVQYLSVPAFLGQALFSSVSGTRLTLVVAAYLLVWLALIRVKLVSLTDGRGRHPYFGPASLTLLAAFFGACLLSSNYLSVHIAGSKLRYAGLLLEENKRDDFGSAEEDYYGKLERFQKEALKRIPDMEKKEDRQKAMTYLATLVKEAADTLATAKAEEGLISVFRNPGGGVQNTPDLRNLTVQLRNTVESKIMFQQKKGRKDFLDRVKRNPLDFSSRLGLVNGINRLGSHNGSRGEIEQKEGAVKEKVDKTNTAEREKAGMKQAAERMGEWQTFQLYKEKLNKLRRQMARQQQKAEGGKGTGKDEENGKGRSKRVRKEGSGLGTSGEEREATGKGRKRGTREGTGSAYETRQERKGKGGGKKELYGEEEGGGLQKGNEEGAGLEEKGNDEGFEGPESGAEEGGGPMDDRGNGEGGDTSDARGNDEGGAGDGSGFGSDAGEKADEGIEEELDAQDATVGELIRESRQGSGGSGPGAEEKDLGESGGAKDTLLGSLTGDESGREGAGPYRRSNKGQSGEDGPDRTAQKGSGKDEGTASEALAAKLRRILAKIRAAGELPEMKETGYEIRNFQQTLKDRESGLSELRQLEGEIRKLARDQKELASQLEELLKIKVDMLVHQLSGELKGLAQQDQTMLSFQKERLASGSTEMRDASDSAGIREAGKKIAANVNADDQIQQRTSQELKAAKVFQRELDTVSQIGRAMDRQSERLGDQSGEFMRALDAALRRRDLGQRAEELKQLESKVGEFKKDGLIDSSSEGQMKEGLTELGALANIEQESGRQQEKERGEKDEKGAKKDDLRKMLEDAAFEKEVDNALQNFVKQEEQAKNVPQVEELNAAWNSQKHKLKEMTGKQKEFGQFEKAFEEKMAMKRALLLEQQMAALREKLAQLEQLDPEKAEELERMLAQIAQSSSLQQMKQEIEKLKQEVEQSLLKLAREQEERLREQEKLQKQQKQEKMTSSEKLKAASKQLEEIEQQLKQQDMKIRDLERQLLMTTQDREKILEQLKEANRRKEELEKQMQQLNDQKQTLENTLREERLLQPFDRSKIEESLKKNEEQKKETEQKLQQTLIEKKALEQQLSQLEQKKQELERLLQQQSGDKKELEQQMQAVAEQMQKIEKKLESFDTTDQEIKEEGGADSREKLYILPYRLVAPIGTGVRLTAVAVVDEYYIKDITEDSEWVSDDTSVVRVDSSGMLVCAAQGTTKVHLIYKGSRRRSIDVAVGAPEDAYMKGIKGMMK